MSRHPYTHSADFVRQVLMNPDVSRSQASALLHKIAEILEIPHEELATKLSLYYQEHEQELSQAAVPEILRRLGITHNVSTIPSLTTLSPAHVQALDKYPNLSMMLRGCVSGQVTEWPRLRSELRQLLEELLPSS